MIHLFLEVQIFFKLIDLPWILFKLFSENFKVTKQTIILAQKIEIFLESVILKLYITKFM